VSEGGLRLVLAELRRSPRRQPDPHHLEWAAADPAAGVPIPVPARL